MMEIGPLPNRRPPKPIRPPLLSPEINVQLNITPEKKGSREPYLRREGQNVNTSCYNCVVTKDK